MHGGRCLSRFPCPLCRSAFRSASVRRAKKKHFSQPRWELFFFLAFPENQHSFTSSPYQAHTKKVSAGRLVAQHATAKRIRTLCEHFVISANLQLAVRLSKLSLSPLLLVVHRTRREASRRRGTAPPPRVRHAVTTRLRRCVTQQRTICREWCVLSSPRCPRVAAVGRSSIDGTSSMRSPSSSASSSRADKMMSSCGACLRPWHFGS